MTSAKKFLLSLLLAFPLLAGAQGAGNIGTLDQWTSTSSPTAAITQRVFGKAFRLSGYDCTAFGGGGKLTTDANGYVTCAADGGGGGGGTPGGSDKQVQFNDGGSFGGSSLFTFNKSTGLITATSFLTTFASTTNLLATGSSTLQAFTFTIATGTSATTTNFFATTASTSNLFAANIQGAGLTTCNGTTNSLSFSGGVFGCATIAPPASAITSGAALTRVNDTNVTLTLGGAPSTALLGATSLTLGWTGTLADARVADNLTVSGGTIDNSIIGGTTAAAGTFTNILATASSTFQNFTFINATGTSATTTNFFATNASTTNFFGAGLIACSGSNALQWSTTGRFSCAAVSGGSASTTLLSDNNGFTGLNTFTDLKLVTRSTTTEATTTSLFVSGNASTTSLYLATGACSGSNALNVSSAGKVTCGAVSGSGSASSTLYADNGGFTGANTFAGLTTLSTTLHTGSTTLQNFTFVNATGSAATTTNFFATTASSTNLFSSLLTVGGTGLVVDSSRNAAIGFASPANKLDVNGSLSLASGGFLGFAGNAAIGTSNYSLFGNTTLTILNARSGGSLAFRINNADVANFTTTGGFGFGNTYYNLDPGQNNMIVEGNLGVGIAVPTQKLHVSGNLLVTGNSTTTNATTTAFAISSIASKILRTDGNGSVIPYTGASCTNQFIRSLDGVGASTCATVGAADVSLANLTATDSTLTFSGTYTGATARTIGLNLANGNIWTAASSTFVGGLTIGTATTTQATSTNFFSTNIFGTTLNISGNTTLATLLGAVDAGGATSFEIPNGTAPVVDAIGEIAFDTTAVQKGQLIIATSTNASFPAVFNVEQKIWGMTIASTSIDFVSGGRLPLPPLNGDWTISKITCVVDAGTSVVINADTLAGGANTTTSTCATTKTVTAVTANTTLGSTTPYAIEIGTITGAVDYVSFSIWGTPTRE